MDTIIDSTRTLRRRILHGRGQVVINTPVINVDHGYIHYFRLSIV